MSYTKTNWENGATPAINADNLNHMEQGIYDAHEALGNYCLKTNFRVKTGYASSVSPLNYKMVTLSKADLGISDITKLCVLSLEYSGNNSFFIGPDVVVVDEADGQTLWQTFPSYIIDYANNEVALYVWNASGSQTRNIYYRLAYMEI